MVEDKYQPQDTVQISGHVLLHNVSYDKDVLEIKLPDTVDSVNYGGNFIKDVCVDEGALLHHNNSVEKLDKTSEPNFGCQMINANSDTTYGKKDDARESIHELKPEVVVPVDIAPECENEKQYSSGKESDLECSITSGHIACDPSDKKISLQELLRLESEEESRHAGIINFERSEKHKHPLHEVIGQVSINDCHETEDITSGSSEHVPSDVSSKDSTSDCLVMIPEDHEVVAELDVREPSKIDCCKPSIDLMSLSNTSEPECSMPAIMDAATTESISTVDKTDSFINVASGSTGANEVDTSRSVVDAASASSLDIQSSERSSDQCENNVSEAITGRVDETAVATSSPPFVPSNENRELHGKCDGDIAPEVHNPNQIDEENGVDTSIAQDDSAVEQAGPGSSKEIGRIGHGNGNSCEPNFFGPSIMSTRVSTSGHIAYSGSVSLRSDSSTTSTRSFAFPVLQREWISSPVRMAKADRRSGRWRYSWRKGFMCC